MDSSVLYEPHSFQGRTVKEVSIVATTQPPGGGNYHVNSRIMRHFSLITVAQPSGQTLSSLFEGILRKKIILRP